MIPLLDFPMPDVRHLINVSIRLIGYYFRENAFIFQSAKSFFQRFLRAVPDFGQVLGGYGIAGIDQPATQKVDGNRLNRKTDFENHLIHQRSVVMAVIMHG
jgi:hypothetical protein